MQNFYSNEEKSVFHTMDYGKTYEHVIPRAPVFLYSLGFLYVGVVDQNGYYMNLWVSTADGHNTTRAVFNDDLVEDVRRGLSLSLSRARAFLVRVLLTRCTRFG